MIYNLSAKDRKIVDTALSILAQIYDQHDFKSPNEIFRIQDKIKSCTTVQLINDIKKRTFADEG